MKSYLQNRINAIFTCGGIGLCLISIYLLLKSAGLYNLLDKIVIPADRHLNYYQLLVKPEELYYKRYTLSENSPNLLLVDKRDPVQTGELSIIFNDDGTIDINGSLSEEHTCYYRLTPSEEYYIPDGYYYLSNGGKSEIPKGISLYYEHRTFTAEGTQYKVLASLPETQAFTIDNSTFDDSGLVLAIQPGFTCKETVTIKPMLTVKKIVEELYEPAAMMKEIEGVHCIKICKIPCKKILSLNEEDWSQWMFDLQVEHESEGVAWTSIFFEENYGLQIIDPAAGKVMYGIIDPWGRIMNKGAKISSIQELREFTKGMDVQD